MVKNSPCVQHFIDDGKKKDQSQAICINSPRAHLAQNVKQAQLSQVMLESYSLRNKFAQKKSVGY